MRNTILLWALFMLAFYSYAQTKSQQNQITATYDMQALNQLKTKYAERFKKEKSIALQKAKEQGWEIYGNDNGSFYELMRLTPDGKPVYYTTDNYYAAKTIRTDKLYSGGDLGINIQGQNMIVGVWDGGAVRGTHSFLTGRVDQRDGITFTTPSIENLDMATHVTGTFNSEWNFAIQRNGSFEASASGTRLEIY